jgi:hypothetical protein
MVKSEKSGWSESTSLFDDRVFNLELLTSLIRWKSICTHSTDYELEFILSSLTSNGISAEFTQIALKHFHVVFTCEY